MYNQQIEELINAALADGVLTEKEKQILFKKAQSMGIDLDEFEMVLDARLVELKKKEQNESSAPKSTKYGDVRKCPMCGAMIPALSGACPECGYEFSGLESNLSSRQLADKLVQESEKWDDKIKELTSSDSDKEWKCSKEKEEALSLIVRQFPIPNTKIDLFELITLAQTNFLSKQTNYHLAESYMAKYREALYKANHLFPKDDIFLKLRSEQAETEKKYVRIHKKQPKTGMKPSTKTNLKLISFYVLFFLIIGLWLEGVFY
jgi:hypothetical protein